MDIELRPLRLAEILDRIFQLYRARFMLFLGIAGVSTILELLWNLISLAEVRWMTRHHLAVTTRQWATSVSSIPAWTVLFAAAALCLAASNRAVAAIYDGKPTGIVKAFAALRSGWLRYIWVNTLGDNPLKPCQSRAPSIRTSQPRPNTVAPTDSVMATALLRRRVL